MGGIRTGLDALQFVLAGASAVSVGTAVFGDPTAPVRVLAELDAGAGRARLRARCADAVGFAHLDRQRSAAAGSPRPPPRRPRHDDRSARGSTRRSTRAARCASASTRTPRCSRLGAARRRRRAGPLRRHLRRRRSPTRPRWSSRSRRSSSGSASAGIAVLERTRGRAAGRPARSCCSTSSAATSARRWPPTPRAYLDPAVAAGRRRDHGQPVPRRRLAAAGVRPGAPSTARGVFVLAADVQPRGRRRCSTRARPTAARSRRRSSTSWPRATPAPTPLGSLGVVVGATIGGRRRRLRRAQRPDPGARASARRAARPTTCAGSSAPRCATCCPACRARCCATARTSRRCAAARQPAGRRVRLPARLSPRKGPAPLRPAALAPSGPSGPVRPSSVRVGGPSASRELAQPHYSPPSDPDRPISWPDVASGGLEGWATEQALTYARYGNMVVEPWLGRQPRRTRSTPWPSPGGGRCWTSSPPGSDR